MRLWHGLNWRKRLSLASWVLAGLMAVQGCSSPALDANREITPAPGPTPLMEAAEEGDLDRVNTLVGEGAPLNARAPGGTPLMVAAAGGHDEVVWYLLRNGAEPGLAPPDGLNPLMAASREGNDRIVKMLLKAGARVNAVSATGDNALAWAARTGNLSTVRILLKEGGNVNVARDGESLLMQVVGLDNLLMSQVLIDAGADVNYISPAGRSALDIAKETQNRDLRMLLVQSGARF